MEQHTTVVHRLKDNGHWSSHVDDWFTTSMITIPLRSNWYHQTEAQQEIFKIEEMGIKVIDYKVIEAPIKVVNGDVIDVYEVRILMSPEDEMIYRLKT